MRIIDGEWVRDEPVELRVRADFVSDPQLTEAYEHLIDILGERDLGTEWVSDE